MLIPLLACLIGLTGASLGSEPKETETKRAKQTPQRRTEPLKLPDYQNIRLAEDWSVLRGRAVPDGQRPKFLPLSPGQGTFLSLGFQARGRVEHWSDFGFGGPGPREDRFGLLRIRLHADLVAGPHFRLFLEGKSALSSSRDLPGGLRTLDVDSIDFSNALVDLKAPFEEGNFTLRLGRQELQFGKQRLVSPLDWSNTRPRLFDGGRGIVQIRNWRVDGFVTHFVKARKYDFNSGSTGTNLFGIYASGKLPSDHQIDLYWLGLDQENSVWSGVAGDENRHTLGARLGGPLGTQGLSFDLEAALQIGDHRDRDIRAFMVGSQIEYTLDQLAGAPQLTLGFDYGSGDSNPSDQKVNTFAQLFPLGHAYLGFIDIVGRQNILDLTPGFIIRPAPQWTFRLDGHFFWRAELEDALYNAGGGVVRAGDPSASRRIGSEMDWTVSCRVNRHTVVTGGYSHFFPGPFIKETGPSEGIDFVYLMLQYTY